MKQDVKLSLTEFIQIRDSFKENQELGCFLTPDGSRVYLNINSNNIAYVMSLMLTISLGVYGKVIVAVNTESNLDTEQTDKFKSKVESVTLQDALGEVDLSPVEDLDELAVLTDEQLHAQNMSEFAENVMQILNDMREYDVYIDGSQVTSINPKSHVVIFNYKGVDSLVEDILIATKELYTAIGDYQEDAQVSMIPRYLYMNSVDKITPQILKDIKLELHRNKIDSILMNYVTNTIEEAQSESIQSDLDILRKKFGNVAVLQLNPTLQRIYDICHNPEPSFETVLYKSLLEAIDEIGNLPAEYYYVSKEASVVFNMCPALYGALAVAYFKYGKKPNFYGISRTPMFIHALSQFYSCKFGTFAQRFERMCKLVFAEDEFGLILDEPNEIDGRLLLYTESKNASPVLTRLCSSDITVHLSVVELSALFDCVDMNTGNRLPGVDSINTVGVKGYTQADINLFECYEDPNTEIISPRYEVCEAVHILGLDELSDQLDAARSRVLINKAYTCMRLIDQFCLHYQKLTTLSDVIVIIDRKTQKQFIGSADFSVKINGDCFLLTDRVIVVNRDDLQLNFVDTGVVYDIEDKSTGNSDSIRLYPELEQKLIEGYASIGSEPKPLFIDSITPPSDLEMQIGLWNLCTYRSTSHEYQGKNMAYFNMANHFTQSVRDKFLPDLLKRLSPYGFSEVSADSSPITIYGGVQNKSQRAIIRPNLLKSNPYRAR